MHAAGGFRKLNFFPDISSLWNTRVHFCLVKMGSTIYRLHDHLLFSCFHEANEKVRNAHDLKNLKRK